MICPGATQYAGPPCESLVGTAWYLGHSHANTALAAVYAGTDRAQKNACQEGRAVMGNPEPYVPPTVTEIGKFANVVQGVLGDVFDFLDNMFDL